MRIIIIGAGKVGYNTAQMLAQENHDVIVIEKNEERYKTIQESLDIQVILGSGVSSQILEEAQVAMADLLIAVTEVDEVNMIACLTAKQYGVSKTIARVRNPEYAEENRLTKSAVLGIDLLINPEKVTALEIFNLIKVPEAIDVEYYADGKMQLLEFKLDDHSSLIGKYLKDINIPFRYIIAAILRNEGMIIPRGEDKLIKDDIVFVLATTKDMINVEKYFGKTRNIVKNVMILGGGRLSYYLAKYLEKRKISIKLIDSNLQRCKELAKELDNTMVLHGDGTDMDFLKEEGAGEVDIFIALTKDDKLNLLVSLLAKHLGVKKTIAQIRRSDYLPLIEKIGVDIAVSPRLLTASAILKYIRRGNIISVSLLGGAKAEVIELVVSNENDHIINKYLKDLDFPEGAIIGSIDRGNTVMIPSGFDFLLPEDKIIVFALPKAVPKVEEFFEG